MENTDLRILTPTERLFAGLLFYRWLIFASCVWGGALYLYVSNFRLPAPSEPVQEVRETFVGGEQITLSTAAPAMFSIPSHARTAVVYGASGTAELLPSGIMIREGSTMLVSEPALHLIRVKAIKDAEITVSYYR